MNLKMSALIQPSVIGWRVSVYSLGISSEVKAPAAECVSVAGAGKEASDGRTEKIMSQDRKKDITATQHNYSLTLTHTQVTPMMLLASCLKGVLRECVLTPTTLPYQHHLALSQPIRMAINHASRKHCHPCCSSSSIPLSPAWLTRLPPLDSPSVSWIQEMSFFLTFRCWHSSPCHH